MEKYASKTKRPQKSINYSTKSHQLKTSKNNISKTINYKLLNSTQIEQEIHTVAKNLENEKINLRLLKERLDQRKKILLKLQGMPKKNSFSQNKQKIIHKYNEPNKKNIGKERELKDAKIKMEKEKAKNENEFEELGEEIDILIESNKLLQKEIQAKRKQKMELEKIKEKLKNENKIKENELNEIVRRCKNLEKNMKNNNLKKLIIDCNQQEKYYNHKRDELESEYQKIIQEYIKRERDNLKQQQFKRQIKGNKLSLSYNKNKNIEIQNGLKRIEDEKISDRTPILDECLQKWREVNKEKKESLNKYTQNCSKIRDALENLAIHLDLDSISYLPEIFQKTEQRLSNINFQLEKLQNENAALENEQNSLSKQIDLLEKKQKNSKAYKNKFLLQKIKNIKIIEDTIINLEKDIYIKEEFIKLLQYETDNFLLKLNGTYLSEFIHNKMNIDKNAKYSYKTINKYLSNVQDYINLIQYWKGHNYLDYNDMVENENKDKLRESMKQKLEEFETNRIMNKSLYSSMNIERKNGKELNDIISKNSKAIIEQINKSQNYNKNNSKYEKNNSNLYSQDITVDGNYRFGNDSQANQQSSIYYPNKSNLSKDK